MIFLNLPSKEAEPEFPLGLPGPKTLVLKHVAELLPLLLPDLCFVVLFIKGWEGAAATFCLFLRLSGWYLSIYIIFYAFCIEYI